MPTTITTGASTITPTMVLGYRADRETRTLVHPVLGAAAADVTLRPTGLRKGRLELGFQGASSEANSKTAADLLCSAATFNLVSTDRSSIPMLFIVQGAVGRQLEDESRDAWIVTFDYQEIA